MRIALLQYPIVWADKAANLRLTQERIRAIRGQADIALLPEMFTTGFCTDRPDLAETVEGETIETLQVLANETDIALVGSFICSDNERLFNRGFFIAPHEKPVFIDKAHLYAHGGEDRFFTAGRDRTVITYKGVKMRLLICYDLRFPVWARSQEQDYDILLVIANWPEVRIGAWDILLRARAIENQCYIAAVNRVGDDALGLHYNGHSAAFDTYLRPIATLPDNTEGTVIADFSIEALHHFRDTLPLWRDTDRFTLSSNP
ncbi:MAG: nitrilase family protein [Paludibacteraceae bacterium]|nr:nitrilase family protein [Paludibacteraceae bacterium]